MKKRESVCWLCYIIGIELYIFLSLFLLHNKQRGCFIFDKENAKIKEERELLFLAKVNFGTHTNSRFFPAHYCEKTDNQRKVATYIIMLCHSLLHNFSQENKINIMFLQREGRKKNELVTIVFLLLENSIFKLSLLVSRLSKRINYFFFSGFDPRTELWKFCIILARAFVLIATLYEKTCIYFI